MTDLSERFDLIAHVGEVENDQMSGTSDPVGSLSRIDDECLTLSTNILLVCMAENYQIIYLAFDDLRDVMVCVGHIDAFAVDDAFIAIFVYFAAETVDNRFEKELFTFVIAKNGDKLRFFQLPECPGSKRRNDVPSVKNVYNLMLVENIDGSGYVFMMIMRVGNDADFHAPRSLSVNDE